MQYKIQKTLIIELSSLPENLSDILYELYHFNNNTFIDFNSDLKFHGDTWKTTLTNENLKHLEFEPLPKHEWKIEKFLINSGIDFEGVERILFRVCW